MKKKIKKKNRNIKVKLKIISKFEKKKEEKLILKIRF